MFDRGDRHNDLVQCDLLVLMAAHGTLGTGRGGGGGCCYWFPQQSTCITVRTHKQVLFIYRRFDHVFIVLLNFGGDPWGKTHKNTRMFCFIRLALGSTQRAAALKRAKGSEVGECWREEGVCSG